MIVVLQNILKYFDFLLSVEVFWVFYQLQINLISHFSLVHCQNSRTENEFRHLSVLYFSLLYIFHICDQFYQVFWICLFLFLVDVHLSKVL